MMTLKEYKLLKNEDQYKMLFTKGEFIIYRLEPKSRFALYALEKFFVEVEYDFKNNKILNKIVFVDGYKLEIYSKL
ncbi:hypothetical protein [Psychroflexus tropicus]|uniref:hypothetical protein n=1 Tax=Psychroflexus tropicus TaxID=197345 RepID=UPI000365386D|nr:hypothetical protein [Psychroflexus tropicus]